MQKSWGQADYVYLLKNLRGILWCSPEDSSSLVIVKWLARHYRNRKIGFISVHSQKSLPEEFEEKLQKAPFVPLFFEQVPAFFPGKTLPALSDIEEAILFSTLFTSPLIGTMTDFETLRSSPFSVWSLRLDTTLDHRNLKFNIRLGDYAMTDFLLTAVSHCKTVLQKGQSAEVLLEWRQKTAQEDGETRYWRLREVEPVCDAGAIGIVYLDPVRSIPVRKFVSSEISSSHSAAELLLNFCVFVGFQL
jgi:hypothetical protein